MLLIPILVSTALSVSLVRALVLQEANGANSTIAAHLPSRSPSLDVTSPVNATSLDVWNAQCDAAAYGKDLNINSCLRAFESMGQQSWDSIYRIRADPFTSDYRLPKAFVSDDGLCVIQPVLVNGAESARVSDLRVAGAARRLISDCTVDGRLRGGVATNFGGDNNLAVILRSYSVKNILCWGRNSGPPFTSCRRLLSSMETDTVPRRFGKSENPRRDLIVPYTIDSRDDKCRLVLRIEDDGTDVTSFYDIWEAAFMVNNLCVKRRQKGAVVNVGKAGKLQINLFPEDARPKIFQSNGSAVFTSEY